jgi:lipoprotein-anchoring transpeptidase ErfK/SrfK
LPPEYQPEPEPTAELSPQFRRAVIDYPTVEPPRTIIIDTPNTYLYLTIDHSMQFATASVLGFTWSGTERISRMKT